MSITDALILAGIAIFVLVSIVFTVAMDAIAVVHWHRELRALELFDKHSSPDPTEKR